MNIHEYQAKALLRSYGAPVSDGRVVLRAEEAKTAASALDGPLWVVKAQIHAGGRGKGHFKRPMPATRAACASPSRWRRPRPEAKRHARPHARHAPDRPRRQAGQPHLHRGRLGTSRPSSTSASLVDRQTARIGFVCSTEGGMDIEEVAADTPDKIVKLHVDPATGYQPWHGRRVAFALGLKGAAGQAMRGKLMGQAL